MGRLGSGPRLVGRIESGVRVSTSVQIVTLRMLLYNLRGGKPRIFSLGRGGVISGVMFPGGYFLELYHLQFHSINRQQCQDERGEETGPVMLSCYYTK